MQMLILTCHSKAKSWLDVEEDSYSVIAQQAAHLIGMFAQRMGPPDSPKKDMM